jgi:outer membrane receptor protein involved in Fe transport
LSRAVLAYGTVATGFRSGGLNSQSQPFEPIPPSFQPDTLISYELGLKGRLLENRFEYQIDGFLEHWNNMQVQETTADGDFSYQGNAGTAQITGAELELRVRPTEHLTATLSGSYQRGVLTQGATAFQKLKNSTLGVTGNRIPNVPPVQASFRAEYIRPLGASGDWLGTLEGDVTYRGAENSAFNSDPFNVPLQSYTLFNLRGGVIHGDWTYTLFANNVTDKRAQVSGGRSASLPIGLITVQPRTVGVSITRTF